MIRKTKIVATIGPATANKSTLKKIVSKGVNVCRINFSHISHEKAKEIISLIKTVNQELYGYTDRDGGQGGHGLRQVRYPEAIFDGLKITLHA